MISTYYFTKFLSVVISSKRKFSYNKSLLTFLVVLWIVQLCTAIDPPPTDKSSRAQILPPCAACKNLVSSFTKGMERTSRGKFEGGDADWEESRLGNYATSEVRLVEVQEKLCSDLSRGQDQCHNLAEAHESLIEDWWFKVQKTHPDLHDWLCIQKLKVCCPDHHYGKDCKPCPGFPEGECNGNGKCKGSGTRKGNGQCICDEGYIGLQCQQCSSGFYTSYQDEKKTLCSACHKSCKDICTQAGPKGCVTCADGWIMDTELGCSDVDECIINSDTCRGNTFCVNSPGSFACLACDKACDGCVADGPDSCDKCAEGYTLKDGICQGTKTWAQNWKGNSLRYLTYGGLCLSTCIIFQRSTMLAALVGLFVAVYISLAEYSLQSVDENPISTFHPPKISLQ